MVSNAVNMSILSTGALPNSLTQQPSGQVGPSVGVLNSSLSGLPGSQASQDHRVYQSTSVNSSKDLSLIKQSLQKNFSRHF